MNNDVILNWLKTKINYVYFEHSNDEDLCQDNETNKIILVNKNEDLVLTCLDSTQDNEEENFIVKWEFLKGKAYLSSYTTVNTTFLSTEKGDFILDCAIKNTITNTTTKKLFRIKVEDTLLANPGENQTVNINQIIELDASGSKNAPGLDNGDLSYTWSFQNRPKGSTVVLSDKRSKNPTFIADREGKYIVKLVVKNRLNQSEPKFVTINIISETSFFTKKLSKLLIASRIHFKDLKATESYFITKHNNNIQIEHVKANHNKYTFKNFNRKTTEYVYDTAEFIRLLQNFTEDHTIQNYATILRPFLGLKESEFQQDNKESYFSFSTDKLNQIIQNIENAMLNKNFDFQDFKSDVLDYIRLKSSELKEMGIFYPFKYTHNIFDKEYHLLEINHIQLIKEHETLKDKKQTFYTEYEVQGNHNYYATASLIYNKEFAYIDPFFYLKNFEEEHALLIKNIEKNKMDTASFAFEFLELLNFLQFKIVRFQHENLLNLITVKRSKNRSYSFSDLCNLWIKSYEKHMEETFSIINAHTASIILALSHYLKEEAYKTNKNINDLQLNLSEDALNEVTLILNSIFSILGKQNDSNLNYLLDYCQLCAETSLQKFKLNKKSKLTIKVVLKSMIRFHTNPQDKLSKKTNSLLNNIYANKQRSDISKLFNH
jgi:hypothetical protein